MISPGESVQSVRVLQGVEQVFCFCWKNIKRLHYFKQKIVSQDVCTTTTRVYKQMKNRCKTVRSWHLSKVPRSPSSPRIFQEDGLCRSSCGLSGSWDSPYQPPQPGNHDCRYWIIPELPLFGTDVVDEHVWGSLLGSRAFWQRWHGNKMTGTFTTINDRLRSDGCISCRLTSLRVGVINDNTISERHLRKAGKWHNNVFFV